MYSCSVFHYSHNFKERSRSFFKSLEEGEQGYPGTWKQEGNPEKIQVSQEKTSKGKGKESKSGKEIVPRKYTDCVQRYALWLLDSSGSWLQYNIKDALSLVSLRTRSQGRCQAREGWSQEARNQRSISRSVPKKESSWNLTSIRISIEELELFTLIDILVIDITVH